MKKKLFLWPMASVLLSLSLFVACNNDDDNSGDGDEPIVETDRVYSGLMRVDSTVYVQENVKVALEAEDIEADSGLFTMKLYNVRFSDRMPLYLTEMSVSGVSYAKKGDLLTITGDSLVPYTGNAPYAVYTITGLRGFVTATNLSLTMQCGAFHVSYEGFYNIR